ncbi:MAG: CinA family protein [Methylococcales bacterium]|jgi:nicotinamide-nucleotide amidase|nr:CinA family protein [Methylococcales bacterium]MBT7442665.1 CinA family protein [Methylococcales bacterium]
MQKITEAVAKQLQLKGWRLATAESCTGGWVAKACTDLAGSSNWFEHGVVTYSNEAKMHYLQIPCDVLEAHGAVSQEVVEAMVAGLLLLPRVDVAVAVSGIAGPGGGSAEKPVGLVWLAWACAGKVQSASYVFDGDRNSVREQAVNVALQGVLSITE